jgi:predicted amidohydrolase YtcJ
MLIIYNAKIHTLSTAHASAQAIAVEGRRILGVGTDEEILSSYPSAKVFNANGYTLIPGLTDAHIHLESYALSLQKVNCETSTQLECLQRVAEKAINTPPGEWILGHGWNQNNWPEGYGSAFQLDDIAPYNPVYLTHKSLHCAWVNSSALHLSGIDRNNADPAGGRMGRLPNGDLNGILLESAMDLIESVIPEPSLEQIINALRFAQPILWRMGLTGVHDFDRSHCFSALQVMHQAQELKLRVVKSIPLENLHHSIELGLRSGFGDEMLRIGSVKLFADGALGPHTAAMFQAYDDDPHNTGLLMLDAEELFEYGQLASSNGISLAVHAIGDRANHEVLKAYAQLREYELSYPSPSKHQLRHRIEHVQVIHPEDIKRFSDLNIIASMQPIHATSDMLMADQFWGKRSAYAYAWREQLKFGNSLIFGSDAPVESPNPFWGIHAAVTRQRADGTPGTQGWYPEQRLNFAEALRAYTIGPALAGNMETNLGKLEPEYLADLIILNSDPFTCPPEELLNIHPLAAMIDGEWVFLAME